MRKRLRIIIRSFSGSKMCIRSSRMSRRTLQHIRRQPSRSKRLALWASDASCRVCPKWCGPDLHLRNLRLRKQGFRNVRLHTPRRKLLPVLHSTPMSSSSNIYLYIYRNPSVRHRRCWTQVCIIMQTIRSITLVPVTHSGLSGAHTTDDDCFYYYKK